MLQSLYVANLNSGITRTDLDDIFSAFGLVSSVDHVFRGSLVGFLVHMSSETDAAVAAAALRGKEIGGSALLVSLLQPKHLWAGGLPLAMQDAELRQLFSACGTVKNAMVVMLGGSSAGFGFVEMTSNEEGQAAIDALNGQRLVGDRMLHVEPRCPPPPTLPGRGSRYGRRASTG
jgi:cold-inducible RNA-binding protein